MPPPTISSLCIHNVHADTTEVVYSEGVTFVEFNDAEGFVIARLSIAGATKAEQRHNALGLARKLRAQTLDHLADDAPPIARPGQWGRGMGSASTALQAAHERAAS